jgi:hypothetical protein
MAIPMPFSTARRIATTLFTDRAAWRGLPGSRPAEHSQFMSFRYVGAFSPKTTIR